MREIYEHSMAADAMTDIIARFVSVNDLSVAVCADNVGVCDSAEDAQMGKVGRDTFAGLVWGDIVRIGGSR